MKDKSGEFPEGLVLHKHDERQIRRVPREISPSYGFLREKYEHQSLTQLLKKSDPS
jgi:hypothetical protein